MDTSPLPMKGCKIRPMTFVQGGDLNHLYHATPALTQDLGLILIDFPMCVVRGDGMGRSFGWDRRNRDRLYLEPPPSHEIGIWKFRVFFMLFELLGGKKIWQGRTPPPFKISGSAPATWEIFDLCVTITMITNHRAANLCLCLALMAISSEGFFLRATPAVTRDIGLYELIRRASAYIPQ